jgi:hypothetical protein
VLRRWKVIRAGAVMFRDYLDKVYGSGVVWSNLRGQRGVPYLSEEALRTLRDMRLRQIVKYAVDTVPYYLEASFPSCPFKRVL